MFGTSSPQYLCIRADANTQMGTGHLMRCLALAQAWQDRGGQVAVITKLNIPSLLTRLSNEGISIHHLAANSSSDQDTIETVSVATERKAEWIVLDGYHFTSAYRTSLKLSGFKVLALDDLGDSDLTQSDWILNQNAYADDALYAQLRHSPQLLTGSSYTLLRREFLALTPRTDEEPIRAKNILVTVGGGDPDNITSKIIESVGRFREWPLAIKIIVGAANPHLDSITAATRAFADYHNIEILKNPDNLPMLMQSCDLAVSAAGSSCWEFAYLGRPTVLIVVADNQKHIASTLHQRGAAYSLGYYNETAVSEWEQRIASVITSPERRTSMKGAAHEILDGRGAARVAAALSGNYSITLATAKSGWMYNGINKFAEELRALGHKVSIVTSPDEMQGGDFLLLLSFWSLVQKEIRSRYLHTLVVHESALPQGRGWSPATWAILEDKNTIPICLIEAAEKVDSGDIYIRDTLLLSGNELVDEWRRLLQEKTFALCRQFILQFPFVLKFREHQTGEPSYLPRRTHEDSEININEPLSTAFNKLRVADNHSYPAFFRFKGHKYIIKVEKETL